MYIVKFSIKNGRKDIFSNRKYQFKAKKLSTFHDNYISIEEKKLFSLPKSVLVVIFAMEIFIMIQRIIFALFCSLFIYSCANIAPLEGGPKDETPPQIAKATPENKTTNFKGGRIRIQFDEFIQIKNQQKEIVVTPPIAAFPEVKPNIKHVDVIIADSLLKPNTTYTINFGNAITDNNEGNILMNYTYIFSTGDIIDSLSVKAKIVDAQTLQPITKGKLQLYEQIEDSTVFKETPFYVGNTTKNGVATVNYMRQGEFDAIALVEDPSNYLYNQGEDYIGFLDHKLSTSDSNEYTIYVFKEPIKELKLRSAKANQKGSISFKFNGNAENVSILNLNDTLPSVASSSEWIGNEKDSLVYWYSRIAPDTLFFQITYPSGQIDTSRVVAKTAKTTAITNSGAPSGRSSRGSGANTTASSGGRGNNPSNTNRLTFTHNLSNEMNYFDTIQFVFSHPVHHILDSGLYIIDGAQTFYPQIQFTDSLHRKAWIIYPLGENKSYELVLKDSIFYSIWDMTNDTMRVAFKTTTKLDYTTLTLNIQNMDYEGNVIFTLLNQEDKVIQNQQIQFPNGNAQISFSTLKAGNYRVRLTYDQNGNGKWDAGNFSERKQPEKVTFFPQTIDIKRGFAAEFDWDVKGK